MSRIKEEFNRLPEWLQTCWTLAPNIARSAEKDIAYIVKSLKLIKQALENDPAITDTIWISNKEMETETCVDRIDWLLEKYEIIKEPINEQEKKD